MGDQPKGKHEDVMGRKHNHTICLDWDGTCVEAKWPDMGDWLPGAIRNIKRFQKQGWKVIIFSARLNPYDPYTSQERPKAEVYKETMQVREKLDSAGLRTVEIWNLPGKPGASVYIDDKAERYHGRPGSWDALGDKVILRLGGELPVLPEFNYNVTRTYLSKRKKKRNG